MPACPLELHLVFGPGDGWARGFRLRSLGGCFDAGVVAASISSSATSGTVGSLIGGRFVHRRRDVWGIAHPLCGKLRHYTCLQPQRKMAPASRLEPARARANAPMPTEQVTRQCRSLFSAGRSSSRARRAICPAGCCGGKSSCCSRSAEDRWRVRGEKPCSMSACGPSGNAARRCRPTSRPERLR